MKGRTQDYEIENRNRKERLGELKKKRGWWEGEGGKVQSVLEALGGATPLVLTSLVLKPKI